MYARQYEKIKRGMAQKCSNDVSTCELWVDKKKKGFLSSYQKKNINFKIYARQYGKIKRRMAQK